jgi:hypothetical protein
MTRDYVIVTVGILGIENGATRCYRRSDGKLLWEDLPGLHPSGSGVTGWERISNIVADDEVCWYKMRQYGGGGLRLVVCRELATGKVLFEREFKGSVEPGCISVIGDKLMITNGRNVHAYQIPS